MRTLGLGICLVLAVPSGLGAAGPGDGTPRIEDEASLDPELLKEVEQAEDSDLDAALARGLADARTSAGNAQVLMAGTRATMSSALGDLRGVVHRTDDPRPGSMEDDVDQLLLATQMMEAKAADFVKKAEQADLRVGNAKMEDLLRRRTGYRAADRQRDLKIAEKYVRTAEDRSGKLKKGKKIVLDQDALQALSAYDAFIGEARSGRELILGLGSKLMAAGSDVPGFAAAAVMMNHRLDLLDKDIQQLVIERGLLEASLQLVRHDAASFDRTR